MYSGYWQFAESFSLRGVNSARGLGAVVNLSLTTFLDVMDSAILIIPRNNRRSMKFIVFVLFIGFFGRSMPGSSATKQEHNPGPQSKPLVLTRT